MGGFSTLNTALTGLSAAQRAMDIAGQNVVNANTPGYSRQRLGLVSSGAATSATFHTGNRALFGGVEVKEITRVRDAFLEATRAAAGSRQEALTAEHAVLAGVEGLLAEPGETGLQSTLDAFYASWHDLASNPSDTASGSAVVQRGIAVTDQIRYVASNVAARWEIAHNDLSAVVDQVNRAATELANLNVQIREGGAVGRSVNELMDRRDLLTRELTEIAGATGMPTDDGQMTVHINGVSIVSGSVAQQLRVTGALELDGAVSDPPGLAWGDVPVSVDSGKAAGVLAALRTDLPELAERLDKVALALRDSVNMLHNEGFTQAGDPGGDFFGGTDAKTLSVIPTNGTELASALAAGTVDGSNAARIGDLLDDRTSQNLLGSDGPSVLWRDLSSVVGVKVRSLSAAMKVQDTVLSSAEDAVQSNAGVNLDEEMTNMMLFQRAYQASARVITSVDEMLDTLINRTGTVGR
ncbi:MAG: flagellar hook-associated protein FlgK [Actinomycetota bacterium]|nr:flagellar hook-associated protein FlgK [Actinomycetota bacterium]